MSFVKRFYDFGKKVASGAYTGIKTGLAVGRHIIDASKLIAKELEKIPELQSTAQKFLHSSVLKDTEKVVNDGNKNVAVVDAYQGLKSNKRF